MNEIISDISKFTLKTSTCELCPSPLRTISISIAIGDGTETQSSQSGKDNRVTLNDGNDRFDENYPFLTKMI